ncbi:MAG: hypothetical protein LUC44_03400 [Prevotellaceae bacterium]|nr:hypothetical protein [Prevotellaceae bacterium]
MDSKAFATYYRIVSIPKDENFRKIYRDYYASSGGLAEEGGYTYIDKYDDNNSRFDGECITYYRSGAVFLKRTFTDGVLNGEYTKYDDDGTILKHAYYKDGELDGIYTEFSVDDDRCTQIEYRNGRPRYDYYYLSNSEGCCSKVSLVDDQPIYESPWVAERKTEYINGAAWPYYNKNGIEICMKTTKVKDYGKYHEIQLVIANNSMFPIDFDPARISILLIDVYGKEKPLRVLTSQEYMKTVRRRQNFWMAINEWGENSDAAKAGYTTSSTQTSYNGNSSSTYLASLRANNAYANGTASEKTSYQGTSTSTTTTYNAAAAYQAKLIASQRIAAYNDRLLSEREAKEEGYLKKTTIYPGEMISGYVNIARKKGQSMVINVDINGAVYRFDWNIGN